MLVVILQSVGMSWDEFHVPPSRDLSVRWLLERWTSARAVLSTRSSWKHGRAVSWLKESSTFARWGDAGSEPMLRMGVGE